MESNGLKAKDFAIEVGIQPGTISNIMSGRNNPSLDVMQRVLNRFRNLNADWLVLGVGQMYRQNGEVPAGALFDIRPEEPAEQHTIEEPVATESKKQQPPAEQHAAIKPREIQKIMIFYTDGTFEER